MDSKKYLMSALLCLAIASAGAHSKPPGQVQPVEPAWLRQMYAEGWQRVQEGVLRRVAAEGQIETFSYGAEGMRWLARRYEQEVADLKIRYDASPSKELAGLIDQLEGQILDLEGTTASATSAESFDGAMLQDCTNYNVEAAAGSHPEVQGVTASASAYYHEDCGLVGDTYTFAYARATDATGQRATQHEDPKYGGTWFDSYSSASMYGWTDCYSESRAIVRIHDVDFSTTTYQAVDENYSCTPIDRTSTYTLDSPAWAQTGTGNIGPLTLNNASGVTLIGSDYAPIATTGLPQAGIAFARSTASKLESQPVDTVAAFANAPVIKVEFTGRLREVPAATAVVMGMGHWISGTGSYGLRIATDQLQRLVVSSLNGTSSFTVHNASVTLALNATTNDSYRWVWTENAPGSSLGTAQWWRKISGVWQPWGTSKTDMRRPVGHANTRFRLHAHENGGPQAVGFDFLEASITFGAR